jgi:hypothetical protein
MTKWDNTQGHYFPTEWFEATSKRDQKLIAEGKWPGHPALDESTILEVNPIDNHVLLVAANVDTKGLEWVAYVGAVQGKDFEEEAAGVVANGSQIPYEMAKIFFKDLTRNPDLKWRHDVQPTVFD